MSIIKCVCDTETFSNSVGYAHLQISIGAKYAVLEVSVNNNSRSIICLWLYGSLQSTFRYNLYGFRATAEHYEIPIQ